MKTLLILALILLVCGCEKEEITLPAPTNFGAQVVHPHEDGVLLHWEDNAENETGYKIYRVYDGTRKLVKVVEANTTHATDAVQGSNCLDTEYEIFAFNKNEHSEKVKTILLGVGCE